MNPSPNTDERESTVPPEAQDPSREAVSGTDGTLDTLEREYDRLRMDLLALQTEIRQIHGLRISELAKSIRKRRYRLLQLEEQIFRARQLNLFPKSTILRRKARKAFEDSGKEALLEGRGHSKLTPVIQRD